MGTPVGGSGTAAADRVLVTEHAELVDVEYLSPAWYEVRRHGIAASEIAAVLGISPWMSPFDLWWLKRSGEASEKENRAMRRGRRYEALVLEDFADEHPEFDIRAGLMVRNLDRPWQMATLDGLAYESPNSSSPLAPVEAKTGQRYEWGDPGSDDIPVHYRCQVLWQMDVLGLTVAYIPVRFGDQYEEYVVEYDPADVQIMRDAAAAFMQTLTDGVEPDIDSHFATGRRLKRMHRDLEDREVDVPLTIVRQYQAAQRLKKAAEDRMRLADNRVRHLVGNATTAVITTPDGRRTFSHTVSDIKERTQVVGAHQQNRINYPRKAL
jgi:putative phage-type endonuclease